MHFAGIAKKILLEGKVSDKMVEQIQKESATKMKAILSQIRLTNLQLDEIKEAASMEFDELRG